MKIIKCKCSHEQQDKMYGPNMRAANKTTKTQGVNQPLYRCTVCSALST